MMKKPRSEGMLQKFQDYFQEIPYPKFSDLNLLVERAKIDAIYLLKPGNKDGKIVDSCPSLIHIVFLKRFLKSIDCLMLRFLNGRVKRFPIKNNPIFAYAYSRHKNYLNILGYKALVY
jgi:hypothetical protein